MKGRGKKKDGKAKKKKKKMGKLKKKIEKNRIGQEILVNTG